MENTRLSTFPTCITCTDKESCNMPPDDRIPCTQHPQMLEWLQELISKMGKHDAYIDTSLENQKEIFSTLHEIKTTLDQRTVLNVGMDKQIEKITEIAESNSTNIQKLRVIVENGLSDRTKTIEISVKALEDAMEKRRQEKEIEQARCEAGIGGFFKHSWEDFKTKFGWILILIVLWLLLWGFVKAVVFHEFPFPLSSNSRQMVISSDLENNDSSDEKIKEK